MKIAAITALTLCLTAAATAATPTVGQLAPDFTLADQNGNSVTLSAARGSKVVLVFYRGYW